jgi:hypothetical protein
MWLSDMQLQKERRERIGEINTKKKFHKNEPILPWCKLVKLSATLWNPIHDKRERKKNFIGPLLLERVILATVTPVNISVVISSNKCYQRFRLEINLVIPCFPFVFCFVSCCVLR